MAVQSRFLQTPTGRPYDPSRDIERSFDKTANIVTGAIEANQKYKADQEAAFGQMYSNLGEIESNLQENYAGINQQMVGSTREFMKNHYQKGGRSTDPDFQATLGQMIGRIKAGAANADRNREMLKQSAELIKADSAITDKASALAGLYQKMQDPDFLISQNEFNPEDYLSQYVDPMKVAEGVWKSIPTTGERGDEYTDANGNLRRTNIITNRLINEDAPVNPDGTVNLNITPEFTEEIRSGRYGQRIIDQALNVANQKYTNLPNDVAFGMAVKDLMSNVAGLNYKNVVAKSARDIERENRQLARQDTMTDLAIKREQRIAGQMDENEEVQNRYNEFTSAISSGDTGFFGEYNDPKVGVVNVKIGDRYQAERELANNISTKEKWDKMTPDQRKGVIESLNVLDQVPDGYFGIGYDTKSAAAYTAAKKAIDDFLVDKPEGATGLTYQVKRGMKDGEPVYEDFELPLLNQQEIEYAFRELENLRRGTGGKTKPVSEVPKTQSEVASPGGLNLNASQRIKP